MIERYSTKERSNLERRKQIQNLLRSNPVLRSVPRGACFRRGFLAVREKARVDSERIRELETVTRHDVIAFTRQISETLGPEKKWVHYGLTSTDVVDSANACLLKEANEIIEKSLVEFIACLKEKALAYKRTPCIGRTHGMHAEVTAFGLKLACFYDEGKRCLENFRRAREIIEVGKLSGAVGNFANLDPEIEEEACRELGIRNAPISTQVLSRDRHVHYFHALALIASLIEKSRRKCGAFPGRKSGRSKSISPQPKKALPPCPTKKTRLRAKTCAG